MYLFFYYHFSWNVDDDFFRAHVKIALLKVTNSMIYMQSV